MGLFICEKCKCVENTALGHYWSRKYKDDYVWDDDNKNYAGNPLCSECGPKKYLDTNKPTGFGKWHGKFPKTHVDKLSDDEKQGIRNI